MARKTPTLDQLFPEPDYSYYTRLNYFPADDESKRRINVEVFKHDPTNYDLKAARNFKWEVRGNAEWNGYGLSVTYFRENMTSGFPHLDRRTHPDLPRIRHRTAQGYGVHRTAAARMASLQGQNGIPDRRRQDQRKPHIQAGHRILALHAAHPGAGHETHRLGRLFQNPL